MLLPQRLFYKQLYLMQEVRLISKIARSRRRVKQRYASKAGFVVQLLLTQTFRVFQQGERSEQVKRYEFNRYR